MLSCDQIALPAGLGCPTCFPLFCSRTYQIKKSYSQSHQAFSHLEQSLGNIGCSRWVLTHSRQVEGADGKEGVLPWVVLALVRIHAGLEGVSCTGKDHANKCYDYQLHNK